MAYETDELAQLIEQALALADQVDLGFVSIKLDEARVTLKAEQDASAPLSRLDELIGELPSRSPTRFFSADNVIKLHAPTSLERLLEEHEVLEARRKALLHLAEGSPNPFEAERQLQEFADVIVAHRATERRCVYGPLMAQGSEADAHLEVRLKDLVGEIETDWQSYLHAWDRNRLASRWAEFALATHSILARAGERMRLEEKVIYSLAFMSGLIQLRKSAG